MSRIEHPSTAVAGPAFVAGATGFTGREVVRFLVGRGIVTYAHVRPDSPRREEWQQRLARQGAQTDCTPWEENAMAANLAGRRPAYVFALLGTTRRRMQQAGRVGLDPHSQSYQSVDYALTALLLRAAMAAGSRPRFIYLSAAGVNERARSPYYQARARMEAELKASGLPFLIARPSLISGPGRDEPRPGERIGAAIVDRLLRVARLFGGSRLEARYASTTNAALAEALVRLALDPAAGNRVLESELLRPKKG